MHIHKDDALEINGDNTASCIKKVYVILCCYEKKVSEVANCYDYLLYCKQKILGITNIQP